MTVTIMIDFHLPVCTLIYCHTRTYMSQNKRAEGLNPLLSSATSADEQHLPSLGDLFVFVIIQNEFCRLSRRINDQRISVEATQHDRILSAEVVSRQTVRLPLQTIVSI